MGDCITAIKYIRFDFTDEQITKVEIELDIRGDCPHFLTPLRTKTFPARFSAIDILNKIADGEENYLLW